MGDELREALDGRRRRHQPARRSRAADRSRTACCCTSPPGTSSSPSRWSRTFGLEPGIDFIQFEGRDELSLRLHQIHYQPDAYERVRIRGRDKVEQFRASRVWPAVLRDLFADLAAYGTERELVRTRATARPQTTISKSGSWGASSAGVDLVGRDAVEERGGGDDRAVRLRPRRCPRRRLAPAVDAASAW